MSIADAGFALKAPAKDAKLTRDELNLVVQAHDTLGSNYCWLWPWFGRLLWIDFKEKGQWKTYNSYWWQRHAAIIRHDPKYLVKDHMRAYVNKATRIIELRFFFQSPDGMVKERKPKKFFYQLEAAYFKRWGLGIHRASRKQQMAIVRQMNRDLVTPGLAPPVRSREEKKTAAPCLL